MGSGGTDGQTVATSRMLESGTPVDEVIGRAAIMVKARVQSTAAYRERLPASSTDVTRGRVGVIMAVQNSDKGCRADVIWDNGKAFKGYCVGYRGFHDLELAANLSLPKAVLDEAAYRCGTSSTYGSSEASTCSTPVCSSGAQGSGTFQLNASNRATPLHSPASVVSPQAVAARTRTTAEPGSAGGVHSKEDSAGCGERSEIVLDVNVGYLGSAPTVCHAGGKHIWMADGPISYK